MKKTSITLLLMCFVSSLVFSGTEEVDVYAYLYRTSVTNSAQLDILQNMAEAKLTGAGEFYASALRRLVSEYSNIRNSTEKNAAAEQAMILSALLGAEKYSPAAADLWLVVDGFAEPLVRAEALMALGRIRAVNYLPQVIRVLDNLNLKPTPDRLNGERVAFGAIISLEKFQDPSGYLSVFLASAGWYSNRIRSQAAKSLPFIAKDPSPFMLEVVKSVKYDYPTKYLALQTIDKVNVDTKNKAEIAVAALAEGQKAVGNDVQLSTILANMRKQALNMINRYRPNDQSIYHLMERSYISGFDLQEKILAVNAISSQRTDEAADLLSTFLKALNERLPLNRDQDQLIREIIRGLGITGRARARPALNTVAMHDYTPAIKTLATQALTQIPN
jgi:HEAT repeat protein